MNVCLVSPAWQRYSITLLALTERRWLCDELAARGLQASSVIVADDDNLDIAAQFGFSTVEMDNSDLSSRFNAGYRFAADQGADVIVHVGSDDWVHPDMFGFLETTDLDDSMENSPEPDETGAVVWSKAPSIMAQRSLAIVDLVGGTGCRCEIRNQYGSIPWFLPRSALEPFAFAPIKPGLMRGIDAGLIAGMRSLSPNRLFQDGPAEWCVDFKSDTNITGYRGLLHVLADDITVDPWPMLDAYYPAALVELAKETAAAL